MRVTRNIYLKDNGVDVSICQLKQLTYSTLVNIMKFGYSHKRKAFYAAKYRPELGHVAIVDTDKNLDDLLTRHGLLADDDDQEINPLENVGDGQTL